MNYNSIRNLPPRLSLLPALVAAAVCLTAPVLAQDGKKVIFENNSGAPAFLFWVNPSGEAQEAAEIPDKGKHDGSSYEGHQFLLKGKDGQTLGKYTVNAQAEQTFTLDKPTHEGKHEEKHEWAYGDEKEWQLEGDPKVQSPIEVPKKGGADQLPARYVRMQVENVENNGHTFQLNYKDDGGGIIRTAGKEFKLVQFHFHSPSEHKQTDYAGWTDEKGQEYPGHYAMEVHFVHKSAENDSQAPGWRRDLAVVGVFFKEGAHNPALEMVWKESPPVTGKDNDLAFDGFDASALMPKGSASQTYTGSLTTPPLSSGVSWFVMDEPIEASREQIMNFRKAMKHNTNRSIQGRLSPNTRRE